MRNPVKVHVRNLMKKVNATNRTQVVYQPAASSKGHNGINVRDAQQFGDDTLAIAEQIDV